MSEKTFWEEVQATGDQLLAALRKLIEEGNIRRIRVRQKEHVIAEFPLSVGVVGVVLAPVLAAVGALTAVITECTIEVQRTKAE